MMPGFKNLICLLRRHNMNRLKVKDTSPYKFGRLNMARRATRYKIAKQEGWYSPLYFDIAEEQEILKDSKGLNQWFSIDANLNLLVLIRMSEPTDLEKPNYLTMWTRFDYVELLGEEYISKNKKELTAIHNKLLKRLSDNIEEMEKDIAKLKAKLNK
jgi:hypothetical protein